MRSINYESLVSQQLVCGTCHMGGAGRPQPESVLRKGFGNTAMFTVDCHGCFPLHSQSWLVKTQWVWHKLKYFIEKFTNPCFKLPLSWSSGQSRYSLGVGCSLWGVRRESLADNGGSESPQPHQSWRRSAIHPYSWEGNELFGREHSGYGSSVPLVLPVLFIEIKVYKY